MKACRMGQKEIVDVLLEKGADVNIQNNVNTSVNSPYDNT